MEIHCFIKLALKILDVHQGLTYNVLECGEMSKFRHTFHLPLMLDPPIYLNFWQTYIKPQLEYIPNIFL